MYIWVLTITSYLLNQIQKDIFIDEGKLFLNNMSENN